MAEASAAASAAPADELYIPRDMVFEILTRLPVQNVLENKLVSREWRTLISCPHFIRTHLSRTPPALLIYARKESGHALFVHRPANQQLEPFLKFPGSDDLFFNFLAVVGAAPNGIVCISHRLFAQSFTIWNPSTRRALQIAGPDMTVPITDPRTVISGASTGFAFDGSHQKKYAIIHIIRFRQTHVSTVDIAQVLNFETGQWVRLGPVNFYTRTPECEAIVNGTPYWRAGDEEMGDKLVCFDLQTFNFSIQDFAGPMLGLGTRMILGEIREGFLGAVVWSHGEAFRNICVWTRSQDALWSQTFCLCDSVMPTEFGTFVGFHLDGMVIDQCVYWTPEGEIPFLMKVSVSLGIWEFFCFLDDTFRGTCKVVGYKESLTQLPKIGNAV